MEPAEQALLEVFFVAMVCLIFVLALTVASRAEKLGWLTIFVVVIGNALLLTSLSVSVALRTRAIFSFAALQETAVLVFVLGVACLFVSTLELASIWCLMTAVRWIKPVFGVESGSPDT